MEQTSQMEQLMDSSSGRSRCLKIECGVVEQELETCEDAPTAFSVDPGKIMYMEIFVVYQVEELRLLEMM